MSTAAASTGPALHAFIKRHHGLGDRLYGIVDAARDKELAEAARERFGPTVRWLFNDDTQAHLIDRAPYLVPIEFEPKDPVLSADFLDRWAQHLGNSAGILLLAAVAPDAMWSHLRSQFLVTDEDGRNFYFRYYDPRVLRTYLPTCTAAEAREFFGPIRRLLVEAPTPGRMLSCALVADGVKIEDTPLEVAEGGSPPR